MAKGLNNPKFIAGFEDEKFIVENAKGKPIYIDGKPTGQMEAVRVKLNSKTTGEINLDLKPYSEEKLAKADEAFGEKITVDNLINVSGFKTAAVENKFYVTITAEDIGLIDFE